MDEKEGKEEGSREGEKESERERERQREIEIAFWMQLKNKKRHKRGVKKKRKRVMSADIGLEQIQRYMARYGMVRMDGGWTACDGWINALLF